MDFGNKILQFRKNTGLSREALAQQVGTSGAIIGRYERNEITPSVEVAAKIANALDISLDYLVGNADDVMEKSLVKKITDIQKLPDDDKNTVIKLLDAFLRDQKAKKAYTS
jgi:transcriptional regulator with XRE-family HTH domain